MSESDTMGSVIHFKHMQIQTNTFSFAGLRINTTK